MDMDALAPWYRWVEYAAFGRALERSRLRYIGTLTGARRVLALGEGDGRMLRAMCSNLPEAGFVVVEASARMIALARARVRADARVRFVQADALQAPLAEHGPYDAVVACYFLDCFTQDQAKELIARVAAATAPGAVWLVSDFVVPEAGWRARHARAWVRTMYRFFGVVTGLPVQELPPIARLLEEAGLAKRAETVARWGLIVSQVWTKR